MSGQPSSCPFGCCRACSGGCLCNISTRHSSRANFSSSPISACSKPHRRSSSTLLPCVEASGWSLPSVHSPALNKCRTPISSALRSTIHGEAEDQIQRSNGCSNCLAHRPGASLLCLCRPRGNPSSGMSHDRRTAGQRDQPAVGKGDAMGVAGKIGERQTRCARELSAKAILH